MQVVDNQVVVETVLDQPVRTSPPSCTAATRSWSPPSNSGRTTRSGGALGLRRNLLGRVAGARHHPLRDPIDVLRGLPAGQVRAGVKEQRAILVHFYEGELPGEALRELESLS